MFQMHPRPRLIIACLLAFLLLQVSCAHWTAESDVRAALKGPDLPSRCRITLSSGQRVVLLDPEIRGDSVFGTERGALQMEGRYSITDIAQLERSAWGPGSVVGVFFILGTGALFVATVLGAWDEIQFCCQ